MDTISDKRFWLSLVGVSNPEDYRFIKRRIPQSYEDEKSDNYDTSFIRYKYTEEEKRMFFDKFKDGSIMYKFENKMVDVDGIYDFLSKLRMRD